MAEYKIICDYCGRNLDYIGQDNVSEDPNTICCEDCRSFPAGQTIGEMMDEMDEEDYG